MISDFIIGVWIGFAVGVLVMLILDKSRDLEYSDYIEVKHIYGHYEIYFYEQFYCACDNMREVREEIERLKRYEV